MGGRGWIGFAFLWCALQSCGGVPTPTVEFPELSGPYMGQNLPGMTPEKFLGNVLNQNFCSIFSPKGDEFFFTHYSAETGACSIEVMKMTDGVWGRPKTTTFSSDFTDNDVCMSSDGRRVVFRSNRPLQGYGTGEKRDALYLWTSVKNDDGWSDAEAVTFGGRTDIPGGYPALTDDGSLYFTRQPDGAPGPKDIHRAKSIDGGFDDPERLQGLVNSPYGEGDMFIAPDGGFVLVSCYDHPGNIGGDSLDLWVSFRDGTDGWTEPANLGPPVNTEFGENCPTMSPDGKYLFFNRCTGEEDREENGTYWVDSRILDGFRP